MKYIVWIKSNPHLVKGGIISVIIGGLIILLSLNGMLDLSYGFIFGGPFIFFFAIAGMIIPNPIIAIFIFIFGLLLNLLYLFLIGILVSKFYFIKPNSLLKKRFHTILKYFSYLIILIFVLYLGFHIPNNIKMFTDKDYAINQCEGGGSCLGYVSQIFKDPSICEMIPEPSIQGYCFEWRASDLNDESLCNNIIDRLDRKVNCFSMVGFNKKDVTTCEGLENNELSALCKCRVNNYPSGGEGRVPKCNNLPICSGIQDIGIKDDCYDEVAYEKEDSSSCNNIYDNTKRDSCYFSLKSKTGDISFCKEIKDSGKRRGCEEGYGS